MWKILVLALLVLVARSASAATPQQQSQSLATPRVFELPVQLNGYTATVTLAVYNKRVADQLQAYLERRRLNDDVQNYGNGGEWSDYAMMNAVTSFINFACAFFGGAVVYTGAMNVFIDAGGALCASFALVTEATAAGKAIYEAYMRSAQGAQAAYWFSLLGECGAGPVC